MPGRKRKTPDAVTSDVEKKKMPRGRNGKSRIQRAVPTRPNYIEGNIVLAFGSGDMSQLGLGEHDAFRERKFATILRSIETKRVVQISAGALHCAALTEDGELITWGCNDDRALGQLTSQWDPSPVNLNYIQGEIVKVLCAASHTIVLTDEGRVYTWGAYRDVEGLMGYNAHEEKREFPAPVEELIKLPVVDIAAGGNFDLVLTKSGRVYTWGDIGIGKRSAARHKKSKLSPTLVSFKSVNRKAPEITRVFAGGSSSFALDSDGHVWSWGPNNYGQCGHHPDDDIMVPVPKIVPELTGKEIVQIVCADYHALALTSDGTVYGCGRSDYGRLGNGKSSSIQPFSPISFFQDNKTETGKVISVSVGDAHSVCVTDKGHLYSFGSGDLLALGNGQIGDVYTPIRVRGKQLTEVVPFVTTALGGAQHTLIMAKPESP